MKQGGEEGVRIFYIISSSFFYIKDIVISFGKSVQGWGGGKGAKEFCIY